MKNKKIDSKFILIISIVLIISAAYFAYPYIKNPGKNKMTVEKKPEIFSCKNIDQISGIFSENFKGLEFKNRIIEKGQYERMKIRLSEDKPIHVYRPNSVSTTKNFEEVSPQKIVETFKNNIENRILKLGFTPEFNYRRPKDNWDNYQYKLDNIKLVIELPTDRNALFTINDISITCGKVDKKKQNSIEMVSNLFSKYTALEVWENKNGVLIINVYSENAMVGNPKTYDITKDKPELIYEGSENVNCSVLQKRNIGKGIKCYDNAKGTYIENP